jgi:hypothetical protein
LGFSPRLDVIKYEHSSKPCQLTATQSFMTTVISIENLILILGLFACNSLENQNHNNPNTDSVRIKELASNYDHGKRLFLSQCNKCHIAPERNIYDQYLFDNIFERLPAPGEDYFIKYISDSKALKFSGDKYANKLDSAWQYEYDHNFKDSLQSQDFPDLIVYIKVGTKQSNR